ncbi:septal ring lytic transglycosylase RlpA family protein [uncultured Flavobacterium sp.]|uniref:septal ring lytic transglycosylase RlpA family protein n=1 Tax=uncultured Flavobacterium sp. TaxID=165435 RepID=UPI0030EDED49|tara:strand:- start:100006 stop:100467 length:462 start_codon:yes stop_codon:yes gene_type:complete
MKNNILIGVFVSFIALLSLTNSANKINIKKNVSLYDTVKIADTIEVDTIDFNVEMFQENAHASYYADRFTGRRTASGAIFNNKELTCAHKTLPFGTRLKITSIKTKKSVTVTVTDRGPFVKGRHIDLSKKAFMKIAPDRYGGHIRVNIEILKE